MKKRLMLFFAAFIPLLILLSFTGPAFEPEKATWISLIPPLLAVGLAFATHNIYISLGAAVLLGGPLISLHKQESFFQATASGLGYSFKQTYSSLTDMTNIQILVFASFVLIMISVIQAAGGFEAIAQKLSQFARSKKHTQFMTFIMGFFVFIDDYASTMIVGSSMRPLADKVKLSRQKLAFLVDATSAPIAGLAVVSTWIGYEVGLFSEISKTLNLGQNGYTMFFDAISYRYYCFFMLIFIVFNIFTGIDFGKMKVAEELAEKSQVRRSSTADSKVYPLQVSFVAILPFVALLVYLLVSLWFDGNGPEQMISTGDLLSLTYWRNVLSQSENNILILAKAATLGLLLSIVISLIVKAQTFKSIGESLLQGFKKSLIPVVILVLAWSLKSVCTDLQTGAYLAGILGDILRPEFFPLCLFLVAAVIAVSTGTSWGTMAILIPTAIPLAYHLDGNTYGVITMISLGSILDGAIMGDHCSPISDTTILSSISSECDHMEHVETQMPYSLLVATFAIVFGYLPAGFGWPSYVSLILATAGFAVLFTLLKKRPTFRKV